MAKNVKIGIISALIIVVVAGIIFLIPRKTTAPSGNLDAFAQCIKDSGAKFYGAFWCPHCQNQKKLFNDSKNLPYVECSTPDGQGQTQECQDKKIEGYPTWIFADGSQLSGELTFDQLSQKTGCQISQ